MPEAATIPLVKAPEPLKRVARSLLAEEFRNIRSDHYAQESSIAALREQIATQGWMQLGAGTDSFGHSDLNRLIPLARACAIKHPMVVRGLAVRGYYVWGQGFKATADGDAAQKAVDDFLGDKRNRSQLSGHQARITLQRERDTTGNVFFALHGKNKAGTGLPIPQVRSVEFEQVKELIRDPDDSASIWFYRREREVATDLGGQTNKTLNTWHPTLDFLREKGNARPKTIKGSEVLYDVPMVHLRAGGFDHWDWGIPKVYPALDWARAHTRFLSSWDAVVQALARFAAQVTGKGAKPTDVAGAKGLFDTTLDTTSSETNPPPPAGSLFVTSDQWKYEPIKANGMAVDVEDAKAFRLMIAAALDVPDHILSGDVDQGNLATGKTLDRPTELAMQNEQQAWAEGLEDILAWAVDPAMKSEKAAEVSITFPPILEADTAAILAAMTEALGVEIPASLQGGELAIWEEILETAGFAEAEKILAASFDSKGDPKARTEREARLLEIVKRARRD